ncbi:(2Fe-2S) ferredoxin domain-containing protein [Gorillibacterium timonense]|uniref:(2Fe-2S) ferredoxin domain-containing protein n=1 Tax=Gorillibacterium timonense TaxID=1689269 RepID=UPI00071D824E|nr:NADH-ubiquinone oxidoreductase-F iron-sulfur binding region domain-containing protein [Gorillibacterium timonense]
MTETDLETIKLQWADKMRRRKRSPIEEVVAGGSREPALRSVMVCGASGCHDKQGRELYATVRDELIRRKQDERIELVQTGCLGICGQGPVLVVYPEGTVYTSVHVSDVWEIVEDHLQAGRPVERLVAGYIGATEDATPQALSLPQSERPFMEEWSFFSGQTRVLTSRWGKINPERLEEAIGAGEYRAWTDAVLRKNPSDLLELAQSYLPDSSQADCLVCSLNEAAPGLVLRQALAESDPHSLIEGLALAGYAVGASCGYIHVPAEYELAARRLRLAIQEASASGLLGEGILGSGYSFRLELCIGEEDFLQKEATALLEALKGRRAIPGGGVESALGRLFFEGGAVMVGAPETFALLSHAAAEAGKQADPVVVSDVGKTQLLALSGRIRQPGICEVAASLALGKVIESVGGGVPEGEAVRAVQYGGPAGGYLRPDQCGLPLSNPTLLKWSEGMGAPEVRVIGEKESLLDAVRTAYGFLGNQSCGRCSTCRIGLMRIEESLSRLTEEDPDAGLLRHLRELAELLRETASCSFGHSAANPLLTYLDHFLEAGAMVIS